MSHWPRIHCQAWGSLWLTYAGCRTPSGRVSDAPRRDANALQESTPADGLLGEQRASMAESDQERAESALREARPSQADRRDRPLGPPVRPLR